jgi:hypothetical protein
MGRFDERFGVTFNDIDFCLRLRERGYWIVYTPFAELIHFESMTRGAANEIDDAGQLAKRWGASGRSDPYFNPNLSKSGFGLALE